MTVVRAKATPLVKRVFLSYSTADMDVARGIAAVLRAAGVTVLDQSSISSGQNLLTAITQIIGQSDAVVIVIPERSRMSEWMELEGALAIGSALSDNPKIVLPISIGADRKVPSSLSQIKALSIGVDLPYEQADAAILNALRRAGPTDPAYLQVSINWQTRYLRSAELKAEASSLRSFAFARKLAPLLSMALATAASTALVISTIILIRSQSTQGSPWIQYFVPILTAFIMVQSFAITKYLGRHNTAAARPRDSDEDSVSKG